MTALTTAAPALSTALTAAAPTAPRATGASADEASLKKVAAEFEQVFLSEMLKHAGVAKVSGPFSGGHGEEAFRSFLLKEYASALTKTEAFGLADTIYASLKQRVAGQEAHAGKGTDNAE